MAQIVVFAGEYDLVTKSKLHEELCRLHATPDVVLDMSEVTFIDSTVIAELVLLVKARRGKDLPRVTVVTRPNSNVRKLLGVTGIVALFNVVDTYCKADDDTARTTRADFGRSRQTALC